MPKQVHSFTEVCIGAVVLNGSTQLNPFAVTRISHQIHCSVNDFRRKPQTVAMLQLLCQEQKSNCTENLYQSFVNLRQVAQEYLTSIVIEDKIVFSSNFINDEFSAKS